MGVTQMRNPVLTLAAILVACATTTAYAGTMVNTGPVTNDLSHKADLKERYDHPIAKVAANDSVKIDVTTDAIMRSCCVPPNLVISGNVTNISGQPIDYALLTFSFRDKDGKVVFSESIYNEKAASLLNDAEVQAILNEKPHFEPIPPGASDVFAYGVPMTVLPKYESVRLEITQTKATPGQLAAIR
ncbi:MAG: FxLYD domain-containing protein [Candidatus Binataceae bacterium]